MRCTSSFIFYPNNLNQRKKWTDPAQRTMTALLLKKFAPTRTTQMHTHTHTPNGLAMYSKGFPYTLMRPQKLFLTRNEIFSLGKEERVNQRL